MLVIVPVSTFWQFALAMVVGVLLDTFVVRSLLVPALMAAVGERSWWPGRRGILPRSEGPRIGRSRR